jgi:hypothetical protein
MYLVSGRDSNRIGALLSYRTGQGFAFHISVAYSWIVRSLENLPEAATFKIAFRVQSFGWAYSSVIR